MANYASTRLYESLQTDIERIAFRDRVARFEIGLKRVWMDTYADVLLGFKGARIELRILPTTADSECRMSMQQSVLHKDGKIFVIQYSLHKVKDGSWMICNFILENINLGLIYRNQFAAAVENYDGDVDYVVDHWVEIMTGEQSFDNAEER